VGFCLTTGDPVVVIDIDKCRDAQTGVIDPKATALLERFPTAYVEISMSGSGIHILGTMTRPLPVHGRRAGNLEIYWASRYILMTGAVLPGHERLGDVTEAVHDLFHETCPPAPPRPPQTVTGSCPGSTSLKDTELIERAMSARDGGQFDALWRGDTTGYDSHSEADLGFCNRLAFWFDRDPDRIDRVFRLSALMRPKWDERRGTQTYGEITVAKAVADCREVYSPAVGRITVGRNPQDAASADEVTVTADDLPDDIAALKVIVLDLRSRVVVAERRADAAEERAGRSARLRAHTTRALGNANLGQERVTAVAVAYELEADEAAGTPMDADGFHRLPVTRLAERAGVSTDTASRHVRRLEDLGALDRKIVTVHVDRNTGEILTTPRLEQWVRPRTDAAGFIESVATLVPEKAKPQWGGLKTCPDHPGAKIVKRTTVTCADCGRVLLEKSSDPMPHPATLADLPMPQDAASGGGDATTVGSHATDGGYTPSVDVTYGRKSPVRSAPPVQPAMPGTIAYEWQTGGRASPSAVTPLDQYTDVALGRSRP